MTQPEKSYCLWPNGSPLYGYTARGCRCPCCVLAMREARNASAIRTGGNRRIGARGEAKRAADRARRAAK